MTDLVVALTTEILEVTSPDQEVVGFAEAAIPAEIKTSTTELVEVQQLQQEVVDVLTPLAVVEVITPGPQGPKGDPGDVLSRVLTDLEQAQARSNLGAASSADLSALLVGLGTYDRDLVAEYVAAKA